MAASSMIPGPDQRIALDSACPADRTVVARPASDRARRRSRPTHRACRLPVGRDSTTTEPPRATVIREVPRRDAASPAARRQCRPSRGRSRRTPARHRLGAGQFLQRATWRAAISVMGTLTFRTSAARFDAPEQLRAPARRRVRLIADRDRARPALGADVICAAMPACDPSNSMSIDRRLGCRRSQLQRGVRQSRILDRAR